LNSSNTAQDKVQCGSCSLQDRVKSYRWLVWGTMALAYIVVFFHRMAAGVVKDNLVDAFNISNATFANLGAAYFYAYMLMQFPTGILADTWGARKTVTTGMLLAGAGSLIFGYAPSVGWAFLGRLLVGVGVAVVFVCILKILDQWFRPQEFSTMSGVTSFIGNLGGLLAQTPLVFMVALFTWRHTFAVIGVVSLLIAVLCYLIIRNTPGELVPALAQPSSKAVDRGTDKGANMGTSTGASTGANAGAKKQASFWQSLAAVMSNPYTWPGFIIFAGFLGSYIAFSGTWGVSYMMDVYGVSKSTAANYPMAATLGLALGSIAIGVISDRMKSRKKPMICFGIVYLATWAVLIFSGGGKPPVGILYPLFFLMGFSCATFILTFAVAKEVNPPQLAGVSTSIVNTGGFLGAAVLPIFVGMYFDRVGSTLTNITLYRNGFLILLAAIVISVACIFLLKETGAVNIWREAEFF
jgi:sugar phosphate permease